MAQWCENYRNTNVYRRLKVWKDESRTESLSGPFIVDVDNKNGDLNDTLTVTREAVKCIYDSYHVKESNVRVFFTGHKGFNIEILPSSLGIIGTSEEKERREDCIRKEIIKALQQSKNIGGGYSVSFENGKIVYKNHNTEKYLSKSTLASKTANLVSAGGTVIDGINEYVRLHNSINEWIERGVIKSRRKIECTVSELSSLPLEQIAAST